MDRNPNAHAPRINPTEASKLSPGRQSLLRAIALAAPGQAPPARGRRRQIISADERASRRKRGKAQRHARRLNRR